MSRVSRTFRLLAQADVDLARRDAVLRALRVDVRAQLQFELVEQVAARAQPRRREAHAVLVDVDVRILRPRPPSRDAFTGSFQFSVVLNLTRI